MLEDSKKPPRSWQDIALEASTEKDPERLIELTEELCLALRKEQQKQKNLRIGA